MRQLIYSSVATHAFCPRELDQLLERYRRRNESLGVTGLLVYQDRRLLQLLEGEPEVVESLFRRIRLEPYHANAKILSIRETAGRSFEDLHMGLLDADRTPLAQLLAMSDIHENRQTLREFCLDAELAPRLIQEFERNDYWRQCVDAGYAAFSPASA